MTHPQSTTNIPTLFSQPLHTVMMQAHTPFPPLYTDTNPSQPHVPATRPSDQQFTHRGNHIVPKYTNADSPIKHSPATPLKTQAHPTYNHSLPYLPGPAFLLFRPRATVKTTPKQWLPLLHTLHLHYHRPSSHPVPDRSLPHRTPNSFSCGLAYLQTGLNKPPGVFSHFVPG